MRFSRNAIYGALLLSLSPLAHSDAFEEGRAFSSDMGRQEISTDAAAELPDAEGDTSQQRGYFQGGQGSTTGPGTTRVLECDAQGNDDPECNAINFMNQNPTPDYPVSRDDPLLEDAKEIRNNAESIAGPDMDSEAECVTTTVSGPDMTVEQSCDVFRHGNVSHCDVERVIEVDREVVYQCDDGYSMDEHTCSRTLTVDVRKDAVCSAGSNIISLKHGTAARAQFFCRECSEAESGYCMGIHGYLSFSNSGGTRIYSYRRSTSALPYGEPVSSYRIEGRSSDDSLAVWEGSQSCDGAVCTLSVNQTNWSSSDEWTETDQYGIQFGDAEIVDEGWVDNCSGPDSLSPN